MRDGSAATPDAATVLPTHTRCLLTMTPSVRLRHIAFAALLIAAVGVICPAAAQTARNDKLDPLLQVRARQLTGRSRVIIEFNGAPDTRLITGTRGIAGRHLGPAGAQVADLDNQALGDLARNPHVAGLHADHPAFATLERTGTAIAATIARQTFRLTGKGIGVAVIDSGVTAWHDDLYLAGTRSARAAQRIVHFKDFTKESGARIWTSEQPSDDYGHGTHVAGIIAGNGFDSNGARSGVAPGANLIALKVLDADGQGYISNVIAAIDHAIAVRKTYNIRVINLSVASGVFESYETDPLTRAARRAVDAGIVVIAAAGNIGTNTQGDLQYGGITSPGNAPWVLTVGAASHEGTAARGNDTLARFSSRGPTWIDFAAKPDLVAPGVGIESLADPHSVFYSTYGDYLLDGARATPYKPYLSLTGTSMAAPVVAGTVALMLEANPNLTPNAVKAILQYTAEVREDESFLAQGAGLLNSLGAVRMAAFAGAPRKGALLPFDTIEDERIEWSRHIIWGNDLVAGDPSLLGSNVFGVGVTWGSEAANIVWSEAYTENIVWSSDCGGANCEGVVWGARSDDGSVWGTARAADKIAWNTDNIVWSEAQSQNIVWSEASPDSIIWSPVDFRRPAWNGPQ
jgi:serine protease AprX